MGESVVQDVVIKMKRQEIETQSVHLNDDRGRVVIIVTSLFTLFAIITTLARLITRRAIVKVPWQPDDYAIAAATVCSLFLQPYTLADQPSAIRNRTVCRGGTM